MRRKEQLKKELYSGTQVVTPEYKAKSEEFQSLGAHDRLLKRVAAHLPLDLFRSMAANERIVFSTEPTPAQRLMKLNVTDLLDTFALERKIESNQQSAAPSSTTDGGRILVILKKSAGALEHYSLEVRPFDSRGNALGTSNWRLSHPAHAGMIGSTTKDAQLGEKGVALGRMLGNGFYVTFQGGRAEPMSLDAPVPAKELMRPQEGELLRHSTPIMEAIADARSGSVVAIVPDAVLRAAFHAQEKSGAWTLPGGSVAASPLPWRCEWLSQGRVSVYRPVSPDVFEEINEDRANERRRFDAILAGTETPGEALRILLATSPAQGATLSSALIRAHQPGIPQRIDPGELLFWSLSSTQRSALLNGGQLTLEQLSPLSREHLRKLVYHHGYLRSISGPASGWITIGGTNEEYVMLGGTNLNDEPTQSLPNGIEAAQMRATQDTYYFVVRSNGDPTAYPRNEGPLSQIARSDYFRTLRPLDGDVPLKMWNINKILRVRLRVTIRGNLGIEVPFRLSDVPLTKEPVPFEKLPKEVRDAYDEEYKKVKEKSGAGTKK